MTQDKSPESEARRKLDVLQGELATRDSIENFAYSAVALVCALIAAGATGKLLWDLPEKNLILGVPPAVATALLMAYSLVKYLRGKRLLAVELRQFESLKALRADLHLDNPAALLPR
ncbi:MAG: hypothetical protein ACYC8T_07810 [Myxococcaceae bacterium]